MSSDVLSSFEKALSKLSQALEAEKTELNRDAAIQRFEFSYELMWKSIKKELAGEGLVCQSPKSCFKEAFAQGWINDEKPWIEMLNDRNLTTHTYDEELAQKVFVALPRYCELMAGMLQHLRLSKN